MTKKPPKTLWVNVHRSGSMIGHLNYDVAISEIDSVIEEDRHHWVGTFKYVLAEKKGKK